MMVRGKAKKLKQEQGAVLVLEMGIVFPLVLLVVLLMIFSAYFTLQRNLAFSHLEDYAQVGVRVLTHPRDKSAFLGEGDFVVKPERFMADLRDYSPYFKADANRLLGDLEAELASSPRLGRVSPVGVLRSRLKVEKAGPFARVLLAKQAFVVEQLPLLRRVLEMEQGQEAVIYELRQLISRPSERVMAVDLAVDLSGFLARRFHLGQSGRAGLKVLRRLVKHVGGD